MGVSIGGSHGFPSAWSRSGLLGIEGRIIIVGQDEKRIIGAGLWSSQPSWPT